ncbi:MAG TPA: EamA family transporter [Candidatus Kapabacteria bacterium]|nr:EamA family transporter [Candidatus Kapabacteria bacterium]
MAWIILVRVVLSVSASAIQKRLLLDRAGVNHTWILTYSIMLAPATALALLKPVALDSGFWINIIIGGGLDAIGNLAMVAALRGTDLSIFGPLNAVRPILALLFGWLFLGESPTAVGMLGIAVTVVGGIILFSGDTSSSKTSTSSIWKPLLLRTAGLSLGVIGAVFLKRAADVGSAEVTVAAWIFCGLIVLFGFAAIRHRDALTTLRPALQGHWRWLLIHSAVFMSMQLLTIKIFQQTLLAYSFVFFQLGMVLQVFVGRIFFNESGFLRRLLAACIMALGSALILWRG